jgi:hypothetical protein
MSITSPRLQMHTPCIRLPHNGCLEVLQSSLLTRLRHHVQSGNTLYERPMEYIETNRAAYDAIDRMAESPQLVSRYCPPWVTSSFKNLDSKITISKTESGSRSNQKIYQRETSTILSPAHAKIRSRRLGLFFRTRYILSLLRSLTLSSVVELEVCVSTLPSRRRRVCEKSSSWKSSVIQRLMMM